MNTIAQPPQEWPKAVSLPNDTCINLTGSYINKAVEAPDNADADWHKKRPSWSIYLSELLVPYIPTRDFVEHKWADTVELSGVEGGKLEIILKKNNKKIFQKTLNENAEFTCSPQGLVMKSRSSPDNMMGITERFEEKIFAKAVDGSILVSEQKTDVGVTMFIPNAGKVVQRYRFLPVDAPK